MFLLPFPLHFLEQEIVIVFGAPVRGIYRHADARESDIGGKPGFDFPGGGDTGHIVVQMQDDAANLRIALQKSDEGDVRGAAQRLLKSTSSVRVPVRSVPKSSNSFW